MIIANKYIEPMKSGNSKPHLFYGQDGNKYVLKFMSNPQGLRVLANEMISYRLAKLLDLPVPTGEIIYISQKFILQTPNLKALNVKKGPHFGSLYIENTENVTSNSDISQAVNLCKGADMILFDYWLNNNDRHLFCEVDHNVLISNHSNPQFWMIDQANILHGPSWSVKSLLTHKHSISIYWGGMYEKFVPFIDNSNPFIHALEKIESLEVWQIAQAISDLPDEWSVSTSERVALIDYLNVRKSLLRNAIKPLKAYFPVWQNQSK